MATYKKRNKVKISGLKAEENQGKASTTAEVFSTLETGASKTENWVAKHQKIILLILAFIAVGSFAYLGYNQFVRKPMEKEATHELSKVQRYFELATSQKKADSLYLQAINGTNQELGLLDVAKEYKSTPAASLASFYAGIAYYNIGEYELAISQLKQATFSDPIFSTIVNANLGKNYLALNEPEKAYAYFIRASEMSDNNFTTPKFLLEAAKIAGEIGKTNEAIAHLEYLIQTYPESKETKSAQVYLGYYNQINSK